MFSDSSENTLQHVPTSLSMILHPQTLANSCFLAWGNGEQTFTEVGKRIQQNVWTNVGLPTCSNVGHHVFLLGGVTMSNVGVSGETNTTKLCQTFGQTFSWIRFPTSIKRLHKVGKRDVPTLANVWLKTFMLH